MIADIKGVIRLLSLRSSLACAITKMWTDARHPWLAAACNPVWFELSLDFWFGLIPDTEKHYH